MAADEPEGFGRNGASTKLVVLLHAWTGSAADMEPLAEVARTDMGDADTWAPTLPLAAVFSPVRACDLVGALLEAVDGLVAANEDHPRRGPYREIVLVGHSLGAVLARAVWALAAGGQPDGTVDWGKRRPWAARVRRLVLVAAVARGWSGSEPVSPRLRILLRLGGLLETLLGPGFTVLDFRRGSAFLTTVRMQALSAPAALRAAGVEPPVTVQLLGTEDDFVAPADNVDLATGEGFFYHEVRGASHASIVAFDPLATGDPRRDAIASALCDTADELRGTSLPFEAVADLVRDTADDFDLDLAPPLAAAGQAAAPAADPSAVRAVVFVVHGIRDYGFWTKKLAVRVKERAARSGIPCRTVTSNYDFFPMGPFLLMSERRKRAGWLMDQYVTARALYPNAENFSFVGHSNGTYLLARALLDCPAVRFERIVFAGSVVRPDHPWRRLLPPEAANNGSTGQVRRVLNYVADGDWVVASAPKSLEPLRFSDLGGAGHDGFPVQPGVVQRWVQGSHSAALREENWDEIADFVLLGADPAPRPGAIPAPGLAGARQPWVERLGRGSWAAVPALVLIAVCTGAAVLSLLWALGMPLLVLAIGLLAGLWLSALVVTKL